MSTPWEVAKTENRRELVLNGAGVSKLLQDGHEGQLPDLVWSLQQLNFLEASNVGISCISRDISKLENLGRLCLRDNHLEELPEEMTALKKLTMVDASGNRLASISPLVFEAWVNVTNLNVSGNQLTSLPSIEKLVNLQYLNVANNKLEVSFF